MSAPWEQDHATLSQMVIDGMAVVSGSRVRLRPCPGGDILDLALAGKVAVVQAIEQDFEGKIMLAVTVEDDPGRDLGEGSGAAGGWQPGHRFFFSPAEVEPLDARHGADR
ncbi:MAG TPA: hypothetical protein VHB98_08835 [Chloroflexota bacterium]|nr:hypothetical protein [Chloroflexota bacterium]